MNGIKPFSNDQSYTLWVNLLKQEIYEKIESEFDSALIEIRKSLFKEDFDQAYTAREQSKAFKAYIQEAVNRPSEPVSKPVATETTGTNFDKPF